MRADAKGSSGAEQVLQHQKMIQQALAENQIIFQNNLKSVNQLVGELTGSPVSDLKKTDEPSVQN